MFLLLLFLASCGKEGEQQLTDKEGSSGTSPAISTPAAPTGISTLSGDGQVTIQWSAVEGSTSYNVYFSNSPNGTTANGTKVGGITETSYTHTNLKNNVFYYYIVTAVNAAGESLPSGETGAMPKGSPPAVPVGVTAVSSGDSIAIRWNTVQGATSYTVYYTENPGLAIVQGKRIPGITATSYKHAKVNKGTMYYYVVTASSGNGESPPSTESGAMLQSLPPATPTGVAASGGDEKITLRWNAVTGAKFYNLYYATATGIARAKGKKVSGINTASYQHTDVKNKTMYYYVVTAVNNEGESPASNETGAMP